MSTVLATITVEEKDRIEDLQEKKIALENLARIDEGNRLVANEQLYQRFINDLANVTADYNKCWDEIREKYSINEKDDEKLSLDFRTCEVSSLPA